MVPNRKSTNFGEETEETCLALMLAIHFFLLEVVFEKILLLRKLRTSSMVVSLQLKFKSPKFKKTF